MRYLFSFLLIASIAGWYFLKDVSGVQKLFSSAGDAVRGALYDPTIEVGSLSVASQKRVKEILPAERSTFWWNFNRDEVLALLLKEQLFRSATIARCGFLRFGCFRVEVEERLPRLIAFVGKEPWMVDSSGAFIRPVTEGTQEVWKLQGIESDSLPVLRGLVGAIDNLELVSGRVGHVVRAIDEIEKICGETVREIRLRSNGELEIQFAPYDFVAIFDVDSSRLEIIKEESRRLKQLFSEFSGREHMLREVDLAFDRTAVVRLHKEFEPVEEMSE